MPTYGYASEQANPRWAQCRAKAREQLLREGFEPLSKKLHAAVRRRALRLYRQH